MWQAMASVEQAPYLTTCPGRVFHGWRGVVLRDTYSLSGQGILDAATNPASRPGLPWPPGRGPGQYMAGI